MPDTALKNAHARRDVLAARINKLNQELHDVQAEVRRVDQWIALWHAFANGDEADTPSEPHGLEQESNVTSTEPVDAVDSDKADRTRTTGNPKKEVVAEVARRIIEEEGEPVSRADLFRLLGDRGVVIQGKDPEQVLSTMMWRTRDLVKVTRLPAGGYWLADEPHDASGYDPTKASIDENAPKDVIPNAGEGPSDRTPQHFMRVVSDHIAKTMSFEERASTLSKISDSGSVPTEVQQELLEKYKAASGIDYQKGLGFGQLFIERLKEIHYQDNT